MPESVPGQKRGGNRAAIAVNAALLLPSAVFFAVFLCGYFPGVAGNLFKAAFSRPVTLHSQHFSEPAFDGIATGDTAVAVEKALGAPLESDSFAADGSRIERRLCIYFGDGICDMTTINYGAGEVKSTSAAAYEIWKYTIPDPRAKSYEERTLKISGGKVVEVIKKWNTGE